MTPRQALAIALPRARATDSLSEFSMAVEVGVLSLWTILTVNK